MAEQFSKVKFVNNTVNASQKWGKGKKTIVFNVNIDHSLAVTAAFTAAGHKCKHVDGETPKLERERILKWFNDTPDAILCNVGITTTGFDQPDIEVVIINKATMSMPLWLQMTGRGSRPTPTKSMFTIIDMGGNAITHGDWCQDRNWIEIFENPKEAGEGVAPIKDCPQCSAIIHAAARECPICGYVFPVKELSVEADLHEFTMVTKNIDVEAVKREHANKAFYYPFYHLGRQLAEIAKEKVPEMKTEYAEYILEAYNELARQWANSVNKNYNKFLQVKAKLHLYELLQSHFKNWKMPDAAAIQIQKDKDKSTVASFAIEDIERLKDLHYNQ